MNLVGKVLLTLLMVKIKLGVQITPLEEVIKNNKGKIFVRKLISESEEKYNQIFSANNMLDVYQKNF